MLMQCIKAENFDTITQLYDGAAFFVDEGDHVIKNHMCRVEKISYRLTGLV